MFKLIWIGLMMIMPLIISLFFEFEYSIIFGKVVVYTLTTLSFVFGLWMIKKDFIDKLD
ncbi:MAG: hypothetical protein KGZ51_01465 [Erysipelothrix sp.]|nr:hypothetical protein [Erysipelothrix sp.]